MIKFITLALAICCAFGVFSCAGKLQRQRPQDASQTDVYVMEDTVTACGMQELFMDADFHAQTDTEPESYIYVEGRLYRDTGEISDIEFRCGMMDGSIESSVEPECIPEEEGQSNFGAPYGYQYGEGGNIELLMDKKWMVFEPVDEPDEKN